MKPAIPVLPRLVMIAAAAFFVSSCDTAEVDCGSENATSPLIGILKEDVEKQVTDAIRSANRSGVVTRSKIRAAVGDVAFLVEDVRTSKQDPNSTKRFCTGTLRIRFPVETIEDAEAARSTAQLGGLTELADDNEIERQANSFSAEVEYSIQPTDDGEKVFAETETRTPILQLASEVVSASLLRSTLEQGARAQQQALADQKSASLESAKVDNKIAAQTVLEAWRTLPDSARAHYLPAQRAWSRKKDADCRIEAAGTSTDPGEVEAARLNCDTRVTGERTAWLEELRSSLAEQSAPEAIAEQADPEEPVEEL